MLNLKEIKIKAIENNLKMTDLAKKLGVSKEYMYHCIRTNHVKFLEKIEKFFSDLHSY